VTRAPAAAAEHSVRQRARARAAARLARAYPDQYRACYQAALDQARAQRADLTARQVHQVASRQARAALQARYPDQYAAHYKAELAAVQPVDPQDICEVDRDGAARARLRALLWLARLYPDPACERFQAEAARLPLRAADRAPRRRRKLAWIRALDGLRGLFPEEFQARYTIELARQARPEPTP
jgi:hypothetical protein